MEWWKQYGGLAGLLAVCFAAGLWGFTSTGGALPWAKRSATALQRGVREGGGALVDLGRGVVVAGPIRKGGATTEFLAVVALLVVFGVGLYVYVDRYGGFEDDPESPTR
jgi:TRAP-type C4-dicarboxylate transport system permease large subunit